VRVADAYITGLQWLARRELSETQVRSRLVRRQFDPTEIEEAVARLRQEGALNDSRTALACARTEAFVKRHGRRRALRQLNALGIAREVAGAAVAEVFGELDEDALIQQALNRRLRHDQTLEDPATIRRVHRFLLSQGFDAARVHAAMRNRTKHAGYDEDR
jgi:regulatory protein